MEDNLRVVDNRAAHRFEAAIGDKIALAEYRTVDDVITFTHTEVPAEFQGQGLGGELVRGALEQVKARGLKVVAQCPFVSDYIDNNPQYLGLLKK